MLLVKELLKFKNVKINFTTVLYVNNKHVSILNSFLLYDTISYVGTMCGSIFLLRQTLKNAVINV